MMAVTGRKTVEIIWKRKKNGDRRSVWEMPNKVDKKFMAGDPPQDCGGYVRFWFMKQL